MDPGTQQHHYNRRGPFFSYIETQIWPQWNKLLQEWAPGPEKEKSYNDAVDRARILVDQYWHNHSTMDVDMSYLSAEYEWKYIRKIPKELGGPMGTTSHCKINAKLGPHKGSQDPGDSVFTTVFPEVAAQAYGPNIVAFRTAAADARGVDLSEYRCARFKNRCCDLGTDNGEILTPGYITGESITGFEFRGGKPYPLMFRRHKGAPDAKRGETVKGIYLAFYKHAPAESVGSKPSRVVAVLIPPPNEQGSCVTYDSAGHFVSCAIRYRSRNTSFAPLTEDKAWPCHPDLPEVLEGVYVPMIGVMYSVGDEESEQEACAVAEKALTFHESSTSR